MEKSNSSIKLFIPDDYLGICDTPEAIPKERGRGFYRYYGMHLNENKRIGQAGYLIDSATGNDPYDSKTTAKLIKMEIYGDYQHNGYGRQLLNSSIMDLKIYFDHLQTIVVHSLTSAVPFYEKIGFIYIGDNTLIRNISDVCKKQYNSDFVSSQHIENSPKGK